MNHIRLFYTLALSLLCCIVQPLQAVEITPAIYKGTLAKKNVVLMLWPDKETGKILGKYYYKHIGLDIALEGKSTPQLELNELAGTPFPGEKHKITAVWRGQLSDTEFKGEWTHLTNKRKFAFQFVKIKNITEQDIDPVHMPAFFARARNKERHIITEITEQTMPYDYPRLPQSYTKGKTVSLKPGYGYQELTDPLSGITFFRITQHPVTSIINNINPIFEQHHLHNIVTAYECFLRVPDGNTLADTGLQDAAVTLEFMSNHVISWSESGTSECGGAHPNHYLRINTLNLQNGDLFNFDELIDIATPKKRKNFYTHLMELYIVNNADKYQPDDIFLEMVQQGITDASSGVVATGLSFYFVKEGLMVVASSVPHVMTASQGDGVLLTHDQLRPYLKKGAERYWQ